MQSTPDQKNTHSRRRAAAFRNRSTPQKACVSETDLPSYKPEPSASPSTPQKSVSGASASVRPASSTVQRQRNKGNKSRNKNGATSPGQHKQDRDSPPLGAQDASVPFAGSTFHASPAASALPMPSFLGVTHGGSPAPKSTLAPAQEPSPPSTDSDEGTPYEPVPRNEASPLDFFFKADRAEKERSRRASSANTGSMAPAPFSPPHESLQERGSLSRATQDTSRRPNYTQRSTSSGIPVNELDGNPGQPFGPAFSTPYQERMRAARSSQNSAQATPTAPRDGGLDSSEALKRYLFTGQLSPMTQKQPTQQIHSQPRPTPPQQSAPYVIQQPRQHAAQQGAHQVAAQQSPEQHQLPRGVLPASVLKGNRPSTAAQTAPAAATRISEDSSARSDQILAMEGDLRRMLKLDPSP
ncbi:hypothetical protein GGR56DRAFT_290854 [Xylariaceae sp. FL0804]|nr:hypothetical protein GGR56DRAFT_290854 [Xylariaceae sp. FL0804]